MKTTILTALIFLSLTSNAQMAKRDNTGNFVIVNRSLDSTATGKLIADKEGNKYPVYANVNGKLFYHKGGRRRYFKLEN